MTINLDHNATTPLRPEALDALVDAAKAGGNVSSVHAGGRAAHARLDQARRDLAEAVNAPTQSITFTSGATEAINLAIMSAVQSGVTRLIISAIEHDAVHATAKAAQERFGVTYEIVPATAEGVVDLDALETQLAKSTEPTLVAVMAANNETGVIQPWLEASQRVRPAGARLLIDAVQAIGKIPFSAGTCGADYVVVSSHKLGGPVGAGALITQGDAPVRAQIVGGGQELGRRAGTENLIGIAGFAAAAQAAVRDVKSFGKLAQWRDRLESEALRARPDAYIAGRDAPRLANTSCLALPGFRAETQVMAMDLTGVCVSAGSACSSGKVRASHVLTGMGLSDAIAESAIRISLGWDTEPEDIDAFLAAWIKAAHRALPRNEMAN